MARVAPGMVRLTCDVQADLDAWLAHQVAVAGGSKQGMIRAVLGYLADRDDVWAEIVDRYRQDRVENVTRRGRDGA